MKKIAVSSLISLLFLSCSVVPNTETQEPSLLTAHSSLNFSDMEKEYKSFKTKALSDTYVKRMFVKYLNPVNQTQLTRQLEFSRYLKNDGDTSYETSLKAMFAQTPALYNTMTGVSAPDIKNKMSTESATFGTYVIGLSPYPGVPTATSATNISTTNFTANWGTVSTATSYKLFVDGTEVYSGSNTSFSVTGLTAGTNHSYYVKAVNNAGTSESSNTVSVTLSLATPATPTANAATSVTSTSFIANWTSVANVTGYKLIVDNGTPINTGIVTSYNVTGLQTGTTHNYYVKAIGADGSTTSTNSNTISLTLLTPVSCLDWKNKGASSSGVYAVDQDNNNSTAKINVYCNMTTNGGGWTLVAAQYESDPVLWDEGIQADYNPTLATTKSFSLNSSQLPADRTQTGFGQNLNPTDIDYVDFVYSTGDIDTTRLTGIKTTLQYDISRQTGGYFVGHNPEETQASIANWNNTLTFDRTGGRGYTWAFSPFHSITTYRGYAYGGVTLYSNSETFAWTVWVR